MKVVVAFILWIVTAFFLYGYYTHEEAFSFLHASFAGGAALVLIGVVVFMVQLLLAPVRIDKEQEDRISARDKQISDAKITEEKTAGLMRYRKRFIDEIFAATPISDYDFPIKSQLFKDIHAEAVKYMETSGYSEKYTGSLRTLGAIDQFTSPKGQLINMAKKAAEAIEKITGNSNA